MTAASPHHRYSGGHIRTGPPGSARLPLPSATGPAGGPRPVRLAGRREWAPAADSRGPADSVAYRLVRGHRRVIGEILPRGQDAKPSDHDTGPGYSAGTAGPR